MYLILSKKLCYMITLNNCAPVLFYFSLDYLKQIAGSRTVPIEIGSKYTDENWSQALMKLSDFIDLHIPEQVS